MRLIVFILITFLFCPAYSTAETILSLNPRTSLVNFNLRSPLFDLTGAVSKYTGSLSLNQSGELTKLSIEADLSSAKLKNTKNEEQAFFTQLLSTLPSNRFSFASKEIRKTKTGATLIIGSAKLGENTAPATIPITISFKEQSRVKITADFNQFDSENNPLQLNGKLATVLEFSR